ncbi:MAG: glucose-6-phosphate dehydrogenase [Gemmatimonadetes bacterium]|nr:glucose-6-phosphate dehydrogenase [Gemmatimonadota bacterium]
MPDAHAGGPLEPSTFVVFGATGDLSRRKLLPALYELYQDGRTAHGCAILGVARDTQLDDVAFRDLVRGAVAGQAAGAAELDAWLERWVYYQAVPTGDVEDFQAVRTRIGEVEERLELPQNRVFYLALPPAAFAPTARMLAKVGLNESPGWTRIVIEKPFGRDLETARRLNGMLHECFAETQIYRIDHYLGKETVQNLLVFRFANDMFETLWNRDHIDHIKITVAEELGVEGRAGYYERAGALRDMVQSHLTQLVALIAMDVPSAIQADAIRAEKLKVLRSIKPIGADDLVLGQYTAGVVDGKPVLGYREEPGVAPDSRTETSVALRLHVENWRWAGVPFFLRTGKRMPKRLTEIVITFRRAPVWMFRMVQSEEIHRNALVLTLQPNEGFCLYFDVKAPGEPFRVRQLPLHFRYDEAFEALPEAYHTLLMDVLRGDQTLFVSADEVEASWALYTPVFSMDEPVLPYPAGTWGPEDAEKLEPR